jgi:hypothetical protein
MLNLNPIDYFSEEHQKIILEACKDCIVFPLCSQPCAKRFRKISSVIVSLSNEDLYLLCLHTLYDIPLDKLEKFRCISESVPAKRLTEEIRKLHQEILEDWCE